MSRRRLRRKEGKERRHAPVRGGGPSEVIRQAEHVVRLAYTRSQAAEALGISRSTLWRVLPYVETIEMPWGSTLIPVDELERLVVERRRAARAAVKPAAPGRPPLVPPEIVERIRIERAAGKSFRRIAAELNADRIPTAHDGAQWWPSTVRALLGRPRSDGAAPPFSS
jgi:hypothetical protein